MSHQDRRLYFSDKMNSDLNFLNKIKFCNMKIYLILFSFLFMSFSFVSKSPIDRINVPGPIKFNSTIYDLAWSDKPRDTYYIQEYLPAGESVESFNQMLSIHFFDVEITIEEAVRKKVNELDNRTKTDPVCNYEVIKSPDGNEIIIDFTLGEEKNGDITIAEFNIYRYKLINSGNNKTALLVYAYSKRSYGDNITDFFKSLKTERPDLIKTMSETELPDIKTSGN